MYISHKAIGAVVAAGLIGQQVQCPPVAAILAMDAALEVATQVGSAFASFGGAIVTGHFASKRDGFVKMRKASLLDRALSARQGTAPAGVPQYNWDMCTKDLANPSVTVTIAGPVSNNGIQADGLPPTCMVLSTVIDGDAAGGPPPTPCGSACLLYDNMNESDYNMMKDKLNSLVG